MAQLAQQLQEYIQRRSEVEGVGFDLSLEYFEQAVPMAVSIFGVRHDGTTMLFDEQEPYPGFLEQFKREIAVRGNGKAEAGDG